MPQIVTETPLRLFDDLQFALSPLFLSGARGTRGSGDISGKFSAFGEFAPELPASHTAWPGLAEYQSYLDQTINPWPVGHAQSLRIVPQAAKPTCFKESYLARIYHTGEIQTRLRNWHDLFQVVSWRLFPSTKSALVRRHYHAAKQRLQPDDSSDVICAAKGKRSACENLLSLWDEGGMVLLSDQNELLELVRKFAWRELFVQHRPLLTQHLKPLLFGHALLDKLRRPYIGLTGNAILLAVNSSVLSKDPSTLYAYADQRLSDLIAGDSLQQPRDLQPFPLLGMPNWWPGNEKPEFYANRDYFRNGRRSR